MTTIDTEISQFPTPLPDRDNDTPNEFSDHVDNLLSHLPTFVGECNAWADEVNALTPEIEEANDRSNDLITSLAGTALSGTSTTTLTVGTGSRTLTTGTGKEWVPGHRVKIAYRNDLTISMEGEVTSYNSSTGSLTVDVDSVSGSGSYSSWSIFTIPDVWSYKGTRHYKNSALRTRDGTSLLPLIFGTWSDVFQGKTIVSAEYWDGSSWVDWSSKISELQKLLAGRREPQIEITESHHKFRFTIDAGRNLNLGIIHVFSHWITDGPYPFTLTAETSSDLTNWTLRGSGHFSDEPYYCSLPINCHATENYWRLTFDIDIPTGKTHQLGMVRGLSATHWAGVFRGIPISWDWRGNIFDKNDVTTQARISGLTAGEDLTARSAVAISADGKVYSFKTFSSSFLETLPEETVPKYVDVAALDSTHIVVAYQSTISDYGRVVAGTVDSSGNVTWGSPVTFRADITKYVRVAALSATSFIISFGAVGHARVIAGTVSGTSITLGTEAELGGTTCYSTDVCMLDSTHFLAGYRAGKYTYVKAGSVSGTSITLGTGHVVRLRTSADGDYVSVTALTSERAVIQDYSTDDDSSIIEAVSINLTTLGVSSIDSITEDYRRGDVVAISQYYFLSVCLESNALKLYLYRLGASTISERDNQTIATDVTGNIVTMIKVIDDKAIVLFRQDGKSKLALVSRIDNAIKWFDNFIETAMPAPSALYVVRGDALSSSRIALVSYNSLQVQDINMAFFGPTGIICESVSSGDEVDVYRGGIISGFSGLTPGAIYHVDATNTLRVATDETEIGRYYKVGVAKSESELLVELGETI